MMTLGMMSSPAARPVTRKPAPSRNRRATIEAAYDAASFGGLMANAWANADNLSADEANSPAVRQVLRSRSRYECLEANSFLLGAIGTVVDVLIGRGPRLQMQLKDTALNRKIESLWWRWCRAVRYAEYLRTLAKARIVDGEGYGLRTTSSTVPVGLPTLFPRNIETERVTSQYAALGYGSDLVDGMRLDTAGEVVSYFIHEQIGQYLPSKPREVSRDQMTHLFRRQRPGQHHGVPELTPSLPLCNLLRQWTLATVTAARTAAKHSALLESQASAVNESGQSITPLQPFDYEEIDYDMLTALPIGWKLLQMKAEQPITNYEMFRDCLLGEIVRPLGAPLNLVLGSSAKWNYASTQADRIAFANKIRIERDELEIEEIDRTFAAFCDELLMMGLVPADIWEGELPGEIPHAWFWDSMPDADPQTLASARETNLKTGHLSREQDLHESGVDIETHDESAARAFGLTKVQYRQVLARQLFGSAAVDPVLAAGLDPIHTMAMSAAQMQSLTGIVGQYATRAITAASAQAMARAAAPYLAQEQLALMFPDHLPIATPSEAPA